MTGSILVVSGPSGSGKTTLARKVTDLYPKSYFSISTTTRKPRDGEQNGVDYFFISKEEFLEKIKTNNFLEWAEVHGNYYGTALEPINAALNDDKLVIFDIDVQGHRIVRDKFQNAVTSVFVTTQNLTVLKKRLLSRDGAETAELDLRIKNAFGEMQHIAEYDFLLINDDFNDTLSNLAAIATSARHKCAKFDIHTFCDVWQKN